jgi:lactoylglutathione lyase
MKNSQRILCLAFALLLTTFGASQSGTGNKPEFDHTTVFVRDLQKSADFYEKVIGLERIPEPFHDGRHIWYRIGPHDQLHVVSGATAPADHNVEVHFAFRVASVSDFRAHLDKLGISYRKSVREEDKGISTRADGVHQMYFQDPDGYWIEVNDDKF